MFQFSTDRLLLRELTYDDAFDIFEYSSKEDVVAMVGMRLHTSMEMTKKYIEYELKKSETFAITLKDSNTLIGTVSLRKQDNDSGLDIRGISCVINPTYWGNGYAPEAIKRLIIYAFEDLGVHKLLSGHYSFNKQSESVHKKLGFVYEGTQKDVYRYKGNLVDGLAYGMLFKDFKEVSKKWS